ncbi:MAG: tetratricopeptide repeat protein [Planctomycetes bacterium]|nr:tetratricopeptide repeat protein [Planctomycetota bacterium]
MIRIILISIIFASLSVNAYAQEKLLPRELASPVKQAQKFYDKGEYAAVIRVLSGYNGEDHPVRHLLMGHAESQLSHWAEAVREYEKALELDEEYRPAGLALAQVYVNMDKLDNALKVAGKFINPEKAAAGEVVFYAQVAYQNRDTRLCGRIVRSALLRFPSDDRIRKLDLALLMEEEEWGEARKAAMALLEKKPIDSALWRQLSYVTRSKDDGKTDLAAIEAAWLANPGDRDLRKQFFASQLSAGHYATVISESQKLLASEKGKAIPLDIETMALLVRAADGASDEGLLKKFVSLVPSAKRTREMQICVARSALRNGDVKGARKALCALIEKGKADGSAYLWAGSLAEGERDYAEAEADYAHAAKLDGSAARNATLYLARLYWNTKRPEEARNLLGSYLRSYPDDVTAWAMDKVFKAQ